jgi:hypothetical protein
MTCLRWLDAEDRQASSVRILKGTIDRDYAALASKFGDAEQIAAAIIASDPEIDLESVGSFLRDTSRVYVNSDQQIVYGVTQVEIVRNPDGTEKLRRPKKIQVANVTPDRPEQGVRTSPGGKTPAATLYAAMLREITT